MMQGIKDRIQILKNGSSGSRFYQYTQQFPSHKNVIVRLLLLLFGILVLLFGVLLIFLPGPAFIFIPLGILLIISQIPFAAKWLDTIESRLRRLKK